MPEQALMKACSITVALFTYNNGQQMKLIKKIILPLLCTALLAPPAFAERVAVDKIEAVVNQEVILSSDLSRITRELKKRYQESGQSLPADNILKKQLLDKLIGDRLQLQIAQRMGLRINEAQLNQALQQIAADKGLTLPEYQQYLENNGENYQAFVDSISDELTINEVRMLQVRQRINISEQEVQQMVERINEQGQKTTQFQFAHILLKVNSNSPLAEQQAVDQQAKQLLSRIKQGEDVSSLAVQYSQGPKALQGGDWGWLTIDEMPTLFANIIDDKKTKKGDLIGPFRSDLGLHILKILDKKGSQSVITQASAVATINTRWRMRTPRIPVRQLEAVIWAGRILIFMCLNSEIWH